MGGTAEATGLMASPFTEGGSIFLAEEGAKWSLYGTVGNTTMDFVDGDFEGGFMRLAKFGLPRWLGYTLIADMSHNG